MVMPVSGAGPFFERHGGAVILVVTDPDAEAAPDPSLLRRAFGWSAAETEVALLILRGRRPQEIACERGVGIATVRSQLKSVFQKAEVVSQSDLVRVMLRAAAPSVRSPT
jgi:DNA-binding CsgD family transcriptional regulator